MAYIANQYNYCTPLSSAVGLTDANAIIDDLKYFTLFDNKLDGSYRPISGDVGLWGTSVSGDDGTLPEAFVVTVEESLSIGALSIIGSDYCYPVNFSVELYNSDTVIYTYNKTDNDRASITCIFPLNYDITKYVITVTKVSSRGVARLMNTYQSWYVITSDALRFKTTEAIPTVDVAMRANDSFTLAATEDRDTTHNVSGVDYINTATTEATRVHNTIDAARDTLRIRLIQSSRIRNIIDKTYDTAQFSVSEDISHVTNTARVADKLLCECFCNSTANSELVNIHSVMKEPTRHIYGKTYITYTDPMLNDVISDITVSDEAYNSMHSQLTDGETSVANKYFTLYDNNLSGSYVVSSETSQVGWTSSVLSDSDGYFANDPHIVLEFQPRPIVQFIVCFDASHDNIVRDFTVEFTQTNGTVTSKTFVDNTLPEVTVLLDEVLAEVSSVKITVSRVARAHYPATIVDVPALSEFLYVGYSDRSDIISIDLLEELTYEDEIEALGGVSANQVTITLDNAGKTFDFNNTNSPVSKQLRRNRKIRPFLGAEVIPGEIEWYPLGTFWSYSWDVPINSLTASVIGFDTIGLLGLTSFTDHQVLQDASLGALIDYVLADAKKVFDFLEWHVDVSLYSERIPYAWFEPSSHAAALRKISKAYPMHIYCDRQGKIIAAPQKLHVDYYYDTWSDSTNVVDKTYSSLYTVLPNIINVSVLAPSLKYDEEIISDTVPFNVVDLPVRTINFNSPYVSDLVVDIVCDESVSYTYETYSWGAVFKFTGTGIVYSIKCRGTAVDTSTKYLVTNRDEESIRINGVVTRDISADFIQTVTLANYLIYRLNELALTDKYDVEVNYRGDISLTINDPILLLDGIAPSNKYNIKRHQLTWDGSLTGTANLNT